MDLGHSPCLNEGLGSLCGAESVVLTWGGYCKPGLQTLLGCVLPAPHLVHMFLASSLSYRPVVL